MARPGTAALAVVTAGSAVAAALVALPVGPGTTASLLVMLASVTFGSVIVALGDGMRSWLCPTDGDLARMVDAGVRVRGARMIASAGLGLALIVGVRWFGFGPLVLFGLSTAQVLTLDRRITNSARPENWVAFSLVFTSGTIAAGVPLTGGPASPLMVWLVLPAALMASRFRRAVVIGGFLWCLLLLAGATVAVDPAGFAAGPADVLVTVALLVGVTACSLALSENEIQFRVESRFDHLTGLLNRSALAPRVAELHASAVASDSTVAVILYDLDLFKQVNDVHGHDRGDVVLAETAEVLMAGSRAAEMVYRLGGEEFAVVLPGAGLAEAATLAERHLAAVRRRRPGGLDVTMSAGISAGTGADTRWDDLYRRADEALLQAKRTGRDRVVLASDPRTLVFGTAPTEDRRRPMAEQAAGPVPAADRTDLPLR